MTEDAWHEYLDDSALEENDTDERIVSAQIEDTLNDATEQVRNGRMDEDEREHLEENLLIRYLTTEDSSPQVLTERQLCEIQLYELRIRNGF